MMHVDPARLELRQYTAILGEWNDRHSEPPTPGKPRRSPGGGDPAEMQRFMAAHTLQ